MHSTYVEMLCVNLMRTELCELICPSLFAALQLFQAPSCPLALSCSQPPVLGWFRS